MKRQEIIERLEGLKNGPRSFDDVKDVAALETAIEMIKQNHITFETFAWLVIWMTPIYFVQYSVLRLAMKLFPDTAMPILTLGTIAVCLYPTYMYIRCMLRKINLK